MLKWFCKQSGDKSKILQKYVCDKYFETVREIKKQMPLKLTP